MIDKQPGKPSSANTHNTKESLSDAMSTGHKVIRDLLGTDIDKMQFDTKAAIDFRNYLTNSLLTTSSGNAGYNPNGSHFISGSGNIQFCTDGSFTETLSSEIKVNVTEMSIGAGDSNIMPGLWEVEVLLNGMFIILMYSTHLIC